MRQIFAVLLFCSAFSMGAQPPLPKFSPSDHYRVGLLDPTGSESGDPAAYRITPPGRRNAKSLLVAVEGLTRDPRKSCQQVVFKKTVDLGGLSTLDDLRATATANADQLGFFQSTAVMPAATQAFTIEATMNDSTRRLELDLTGLEVESQLPQLARTLVSNFLNERQVQQGLACLNLPAETERILQAVEDSLPRTFSAAFLRVHNFSPQRHFADLDSGMRLCLSSVEFFTRATGNSTAKLVRQGALQCVPVHRKYDAQLGFKLDFQPLLASFENFGIGNNKSSRNVTDGVDLADPAASRRYFRLFYPDRVDRFDDFKENDPAEVRLLGADSIEELECAAECGHAALQGFCGEEKGDGQSCLEADVCKDLPAAPRLCFKFPEKVVPTLEINVQLAGEPAWVPLGTTLIDVLDQFGDAGIFRTNSPHGDRFRACQLLKRIELRRKFGDELRKIKFEDCGTGALYLPLVKGDQISW